MKDVFKFYPNESKIYDYLFFPGIVNHKEDREEDGYMEYVSKEYKELWSNIKIKLKPFKNIISKYYYEEFSLIYLFTTTHSFFDFQEPKDYLNYLLTLDDYEILKSVIYSLEIKENLSNDKAATDLIESLIIDEEKLMQWINKLSFSGETKWQILSFSKAPKKSLLELAQTMESLEPIFYEYYKSYEERLIAYGEKFISRLNSINEDSLWKITEGTLNDSLIPDDKGRFVVSCFNTYGIHLFLNSKPPFISWGYQIENFFEAKRQNQENSLMERVSLFKNLGDKTRYEVLRCIAKGITSTKLIAQQLGVSSATISYHINNLTTNKLIAPTSKEGKFDLAINYEFIEECFAELKKELNINRDK